MSEEMLQCFDENGSPSEVRSRREIKTGAPRWWCGVATVWLVNDAGEIMVSRRSGSVSANPGKWQSYFGGHVEAGRGFLQTAQIELAQEAGLEYPVEAFYWVASAKNEEKKVHAQRYALRFNGAPEDLHFVDGEVEEARWMSMEAQWREKEDRPDVWCNGCAPEHQVRIWRWLHDQVT